MQNSAGEKGILQKYLERIRRRKLGQGSQFGGKCNRKDKKIIKWLWWYRWKGKILKGCVCSPFRIQRVDKLLHMRGREEKDCEIWIHRTGKRTIIFTKKMKNLERSEFNRGGCNSVIDGSIYLLFINYSSLSVTSFHNFCSLGETHCL